ncbi:MAG: hypothetical protein ACE5JL_18065, partial [Dehalococcoidia bacterium]
YHCLNGSYQFASYVVGGGWVVDWQAQWQDQVRRMTEIFFEQLEAVAAALSAILGTTVTPQQLYGAQVLDPDDPKAPKLEGGNWKFLVPSGVSVPSCPYDRCGASPSLHVEGQYVHLDTANPFRSFPIGAVVHLGVDLILGNTFWATGIPR